jgi:hypothetical protein
MRAISGAAATALTGPMVPGSVLVDMALSSPLRLCTGGWSLVWAGNTYTGVGSLGGIAPSEEQSGTPNQINFAISGVPLSQVSLVLSEAVQGKAVTVRVAIMDPDTYAVLDAPIEWSGTLDTMVITEDGESATISVSAEHAGVDLLRAVPVRYTDTDQQRLFAGDLGFEFITDQADKTVIWPAASFFRR